MESSTIAPAGERAVDAQTVNEALRRTAANHPDVVAVRTADDSVSLTWSELLARVDAVAGGLAQLGVSRGDTVAIMLGNRPEFHIVDLAAVTLGATPFSIYTTYPPSEIEYLCTDAGVHVLITEQAFLPSVLKAREQPARAGARDRGRRRRARRHDPAVGGRGLRPGLRRRRCLGPGGPRRPRDADLHVGHDRAAEGRPAFAPRDHVLRARRSGGDPDRRRRTRDLVAAGRPHRRADGPSLHPGDLRGDDHDLPRPARDPQLPAAGAPDLVLRGAADLGEAQGRPGDDAGRAARGAAQADRAGDGRVASARAAAPARRAGPRGARAPGRRGRRAAVLEASRDARARSGPGSQRRRRADAARGARVLPFAGDRAGRAVGDVRDLRSRHRQPPGRGQDRNRRPAVARASR